MRALGNFQQDLIAEMLLEEVHKSLSDYSLQNPCRTSWKALYKQLRESRLTTFAEPLNPQDQLHQLAALGQPSELGSYRHSEQDMGFENLGFWGL